MFEMVPYRNFRSLGRLRRDFDDLFERFFGDVGLPELAKSDAFVPSVDVKETEDAVEITAEVPGMKPEDIEVTLTGDILSLKGEKKEEHEEKKGGYHYTERKFGSFQRSFRLPVEVDRSKLEATHKDGVLKVVLPKVEKAKPTTIEVKAN